MASMRRLNRRLGAWTQYARRTYWNPRHSRPEWMGPNTALAAGHLRAWNARELERERRDCLRAARHYWPEDDEPRCTLTAGSACYCTGRAGCQMQHDEDTDHEDDEERFGDDPGEPWPAGTVVTIDTGGLT